ncbi:MAG: hypothetical protein ACREBQ_14225, partial [Nitrososphaerales archaeon]
EFLLPQSSWNSSIEAAAYLNNKLVSEASYRLAVEIPKGDPVPQFDQWEIPLNFSETLQPGAQVTFAVLPSSIIYLFISSGTGNSAIKQNLSDIPTTLPASSLTGPLFYAWGQTG